MKRTLIFLFALILATGCHNHASDHSAAVTEAPAITQLDTTGFLSAFKPLTSDSISLTSSEYDFHGNKQTLIKGIGLDEKYAALIPPQCFEGGDNVFSGVDSAYAVGHFDIDARYQAYLLRHPGMYNSSQISLYVYDRQARHFTNSHMLVAESWGDAGDYFYINSVIKNLNKANLIITLDKGLNRPDQTDSLGFRYDNFDSTLIYTFDKGNFILRSAAEEKRWQDEPMKVIMNSSGDSSDNRNDH